MASPALTTRRDRSAVLRDGPPARRPRRGAPPRSRQAPPPTSPGPVHVPPRPIPAKGHHPACGQLLPGPVQYHRRRMIRYCRWARCLRRSQRSASPTGHHPPGAPRPTHRPSADRAGRPRTRRSARRSRTRAVRPPRRRAGLSLAGGPGSAAPGAPARPRRPGPPACPRRPGAPACPRRPPACPRRPGAPAGNPASRRCSHRGGRGHAPRPGPPVRVRRAGPDPLCARADLPGGRDRMGLARITRRRQRRRARRRRAVGRRRRPAALAAPRGRTARQPAAVR